MLANQINKSTTKIIEKAMLDGLKILKEISNELNISETIIKNKLIEPKNFSELYEHFISIVCYSKSPLDQQNYCGFIEASFPEKLDELNKNSVYLEYLHFGKKLNNCPNEINLRFLIS
uniref:Uncharacterized protein n=1 Tax=Meloidogyne hapla TaxID=6305 RepID=A0A1I8BGM9_MELHA